MKTYFLIAGLSIVFLITISNQQVVYGQECGYADENNFDMCCTAKAKIDFERKNATNALDTLCSKLPNSPGCSPEEVQNTKEISKNFIPSSDVLNSVTPCYTGTPSMSSDLFNPLCKCISKDTVANVSNVCGMNLEKNSKEFFSCTECFKNQGYWSGLGCFYFSDWNKFFEKNVFGFFMGLAGILAFFCIIYSAFLMQTSSGNPEKVKNAQAMLTSCVMGFLLIIFSVIILGIIGVDILRIPGFG